MKKHLWILTTAALLASLNGHAAPVFQTATTDVGESSTLTIEKPAGTQAGDLLVAALMFEQGKRVSVSAPSGWILVRRKNKSRNIGMGVYYHIADESEPASYSFPVNKNLKWAASISRISGADIENPIGASGSSSGRNGSVTAPSITTAKDNALILAFYTNRRNATYTPHGATIERYDAPNAPEGLPSNMLATFEKTTAGATGNKTANPSRSDRQWVGMQISINNGAAAPIDLSGFSVSFAGAPVVGDEIALQITNAQNTDGTSLNGPVASAVVSPLDGVVFDENIVFADGNATASITLTTVAVHTLTAAVAGVTDPQNLTVIVSRWPITLSADPQSKTQGDSDPALTTTLTLGSLLADVPLVGDLTRDPGEAEGLYAIRQGSLTDAGNPAYAITFVSADLEILPIEEPPPPPPPLPGTGIWISADELAGLPMSGEPWQQLKNDADLYWGVPNLSDQEDKANIYTMSKALVYARTGIESYRTDVIEACMQAIGSEDGGNVLALARNLGAFVIAADLVGLPAEEEALFSEWLEEVCFEELDGRTLISTHEDRPNSWGTHAGGSRVAVAAYLNNQEELDRCAQVFKGWLGDRTSYVDFIYGDLSWQADSARPVGINPSGATLQGYNVDGVLPDDQRRSGGFVWPPPKVGSAYETMQGALLQAVILHRAGYDVWNWENQALLRAFIWLHDIADFPAEGDDLWQPFLINYFYGADFPTPEISRFGKNVARTCWTHSELYSPPPTNLAPLPNPNLEYYPGDFSGDTILGNSLPGIWRPFSADSPWNTPVPTDAPTHVDSVDIMNLVTNEPGAYRIRLVNNYLTPIWVVNSENALPVSNDTSPSANLIWTHMTSVNIFHEWDADNNKTSDVPIPLATGMYSEPPGTSSPGDGHMCIIDPFKKIAYEMSKYFAWTDDTPSCTTFNLWDLTGSGVGDDPTDMQFSDRWWRRGAKASGFSLIGGILRPEELLSGEIRHALTFSFPKNRISPGDRQIMMYPPACRSDGAYLNTDTEKYPIEGMLFQLDPVLTDEDFDAWGLTTEGKVLARALQKYGMYLGDNGGYGAAIAVQLLGPDEDSNRAAWEELAPGFYDSVKKIQTHHFRVVELGQKIIEKRVER